MVLTGVLVCVFVVGLFNTGPQAVASLTSDFTVSPEKLTLAHNMSTVGGLVTLTCEATNLPVSGNLNSISVKRRVEVNGNIEDQTLATLAMINGAETVVIPNPLPGVTPTGSFATNKVVITMEQTKCADAGNYTCGVSGLDFTSGAPLSDTSVKVLDVEVSPGPIDLTPDPSGKDVWTVQEILELRCSGPVGTVVSGETKIDWKWETRVKLGQQQFTSWTAYDGDPSDIAPPESVPGDCFETQTSILKRNLTTGDTDREYRCYITRNNVRYTQFAATHFVGTVFEVSITTPSSNTGGGGGGDPSITPPSRGAECDSPSYFGYAVGASLAFAVTIVFDILIVIWLWKRQWKLPCAKPVAYHVDHNTGPRDTPSGHVTAAPSREADYLEIVTPPAADDYMEPEPRGETPAGPYDSLQMSDVGKRSVYSEIASTVKPPARVDVPYEIMK
ncbi:uncharacterized protein LOC143291631 isoform X2 [Babylonia areolata]|uniref:uncharacterized protein LOC143291631 isoform X2 n=1 Tax=Babylonia areolata TaxID=304850 RepID=UPI003FCF06E6